MTTTKPPLTNKDLQPHKPWTFEESVDVKKEKKHEGKKMKQKETFWNKERSLGRLLASISISILFVIIMSGSFYTIGPGERGIITTFGNPDMNPKSEGLHLKIPIAQHVTKIDIKTLKYEADASAASKDLQVVSTKIAVNYHLESSSTPTIFKEIGLDYSNKIIQPAVQEIVKQATAKYTAEELITKRENVKQEIDILLKERLAGKGIVMETTSITNFDFSVEFNKAIENKVTQEQNALAAKNKLEQVKYEAQQSVEKAKGEAAAIQAIDEQLSRSPTYVQYLATTKWDGRLPYATGGAMPLIALPQGQ